MSSRMYCTTWGRVPVLCINYKWKANVNSCIIRKKRKGRGGRKEGRKEGKHGVFGHHKPTLIRPFLAKDCSLFFLMHLFSLEANDFTML